MSITAGVPLPPGWSIIVIPVETAITNASELDGLLRANLPNTSKALVMADFDIINPPSVNYTLVGCVWLRPNNATTGAYIRYANGSYSTGTNWSLSYTTNVAAGTNLTVAYIDANNI